MGNLGTRRPIDWSGEKRRGRRNLVAAHLPIVGLVHAHRHGVGAGQGRQQAVKRNMRVLK
jgi:hypothetical protein